MAKRKSNHPARQPQQKQQNNQESRKLAHIKAEFSGPVPHPSILQGYDNIIPGAAERILKMAEQDAAHQREIEKLALTSAVSEVKRGQVFGLNRFGCIRIMHSCHIA